MADVRAALFVKGKWRRRSGAARKCPINSLDSAERIKRADENPPCDATMKQRKAPQGEAAEEKGCQALYATLPSK